MIAYISARVKPVLRTSLLTSLSILVCGEACSLGSEALAPGDSFPSLSSPPNLTFLVSAPADGFLRLFGIPCFDNSKNRVNSLKLKQFKCWFNQDLRSLYLQKERWRRGGLHLLASRSFDCSRCYYQRRTVSLSDAVGVVRR